MKWKFGKSGKLFYFQIRESPAPLNIPTPSPAPDRGGPVACLSGQCLSRLLSVLSCLGAAIRFLATNLETTEPQRSILLLFLGQLIAYLVN